MQMIVIAVKDCLYVYFLCRKFYFSKAHYRHSEKKQMTGLASHLLRQCKQVTSSSQHLYTDVY